MDTFNLFLNALLLSYVRFFGAGRLLLSLMPFAAGTGLLVLWAYRRFSNQEAILRTKKRLQAHLLEFRLFSDEPAVLWRSYKSVLLLSVQYLALSLRPLLVIALPLLLLLARLDVFYGARPLRVGEASVLTVQLTRDINPSPDFVQVEPPAGLTVETPAVRVFTENQVSWRIRPLQQLSGQLKIRAGGEEIHKDVRAGDIVAAVSPCKTASFLVMMQHPGEGRLISDAVEWVSIDYPATAIGPDGFGFHWLVWFSAISFLTAWIFKKKFGVVL